MLLACIGIGAKIITYLPMTAIQDRGQTAGLKGARIHTQLTRQVLEVGVYSGIVPDGESVPRITLPAIHEAHRGEQLLAWGGGQVVERVSVGQDVKEKDERQARLPEVIAAKAAENPNVRSEC